MKIFKCILIIVSCLAVGCSTVTTKRALSNPTKTVDKGTLEGVWQSARCGIPWGSFNAHTLTWS